MLQNIFQVQKFLRVIVQPGKNGKSGFSSRLTIVFLPPSNRWWANHILFANFLSGNIIRIIYIVEIFLVHKIHAERYSNVVNEHRGNFLNKTKQLRFITLTERMKFTEQKR